MNSFGAPSISASMAMSDDYNNSVNASRFVKGFGIDALIYSALLFLGINLIASGIGIGVGLFIYRYDEGQFYRILGATVIVEAKVYIEQFILFLYTPLLALLIGAIIFIGGGIALLSVTFMADQPGGTVVKLVIILALFSIAIGLVFLIPLLWELWYFIKYS